MEKMATEKTKMTIEEAEKLVAERIPGWERVKNDPQERRFFAELLTIEYRDWARDNVVGDVCSDDYYDVMDAFEMVAGRFFVGICCGEAGRGERRG